MNGPTAFGAPASMRKTFSGGRFASSSRCSGLSSSSVGSGILAMPQDYAAVSQLEFDEEAGKQLESLYRIADAVRRRRHVRTALAAQPGERVLDVGCGPGFYCAELLEEVGPDGSVVGLDGSPP